MIEKHPTDKYLIEEYRSGNTSVLAVLVKKWHRKFCEKAFWILQDRDLSKDVAQECWIIIINKLNDLKNIDSFKSWAFRIIYTKAIDAHKRRTKDREQISALTINEDSQTTTDEFQEDVKKNLLKAIRKLPKQKQDIIRLFYVEEYSMKEISTFLGIPVGTVKSRLFKAREKLKSLVKNNKL